ncbi:exocyst complex component 7-like isoform X2 [Anneissia japonica]|uniref:exocyst complex component 7-like isoform X1 n=1 Tax=Anneissia japonica TaxID=1529436 RepID=UPI0014258894|nr:exocyst complex component 7-like isoform X1 [Anneissia japonica]XP_033107982.1 exocyst complex component 7-like isoform X2 [Anneissia japonica]
MMSGRRQNSTPNYLQIAKIEDSTQKIVELDEKLEQEQKDLSFIRENLDKSNQLTRNMVSILSSFESRLKKLEETILPVHNETVALQHLQANVEKSLKAFDEVLTYHNVVRDAEQFIKEGASGRIEEYLAKMGEIQEAREYFRQNNPGSPELSKATSQFNMGKESLQNEFRSMLNRHSKLVPAIMILDLIEGDEDFQDEGAPPFEHLPEKAVQELSMIAKWLQGPGESSDYIDVYHAIRASALKRSIEGMKDHLMKKSGGSGSSGHAMASPMSSKGKAKDPTKRSSLVKPVMKKSPAYLLIASFESAKRQNALTSTATDMREEGSMDIETEQFILSILALLKLIQSEALLMNSIIPYEHHRKTFDKIIDRSMEMVAQDGENINTNAKRAIGKHDFSALLSIFPVLKHLNACKAEFDEQLMGTAPSTRLKLPDLTRSLQQTGSKALDEFFEIVKNDPDKSNMPRDGTVHELTSNAVIFMENLQEFIDTTSSMLSTQKDAILSRGSDDTAKKKLVAAYIAKVLGALGLNLDQKAKTYNDQYLGAIFLLNNYHYLLKSLQRSGLIQLVMCFNPDVESHYEQIIKDQKVEYTKSWSRVITQIHEASRPPFLLEREAGGRLKDRERQHIKDKFKGFNTELEDLFKVQKCYAVPDEQLRKMLREENKATVINAYRTFMERYATTNFTKNPEKYIKYHPDQVGSMIDKFFDVTA